MNELEILNALAAEQPVIWPAPSESFDQKFLQRAFEHGAHSLAHARLALRSDGPASLRQKLQEAAVVEGIGKSLRAAETRRLLEVLDNQGIRALLLKGMPLAYLLYEQPYLRPSFDVDIWVQPSSMPAVEAVLIQNGYESPISAEGSLSSYQKTYSKTQGGFFYAFDFHWKISNAAPFSGMLEFEESWAESLPVPALGGAARTLCFEHALLLACAHRVGHHHDDDRLIWLYDILLLFKRLAPEQQKRFIRLAKHKQVAQICQKSLEQAYARFSLEIRPPEWGGAGEIFQEPSAGFLGGHSPRWTVFTSRWRILKTSERVRYVAELLFPPKNYMIRKYNVRRIWMLPFWYFYRAARATFRAFFPFKGQ